jgi:hypothetical protein
VTGHVTNQESPEHHVTGHVTNQESSEHHMTWHVTSPSATNQEGPEHHVTGDVTNQEGPEHHVTGQVTPPSEASTEPLPSSPEAKAAVSSPEDIIVPTKEYLLYAAVENSGSNTEQVAPMTPGSELDQDQKKSETEELAEEVGQPISDQDGEQEQQIVAEVTGSGTEPEGAVVTTSENVFGSSQKGDIKPEDVELVVNDSSDGATGDHAHVRHAGEELGHDNSSPD